MANTIKLKRGDTTPTTSDIVDGEVAIDKTAKKLYINDDGTIKEIGGGTGVDNGVLTLEGIQPKINFTDSGDNPDYALIVDAGVFAIGDVTSNAVRFQVNSDGHIDLKTNVDCEAGLDVTGNITTTGSIEITGASTVLKFTENDANPDFGFLGNAGSLRVQDITNSANLFIFEQTKVRSIKNFDAEAGLDVTGNITVTGTVDGVDVATMSGRLAGLVSGNTGVLLNGVTATTQSAGDDSTKIATTAYTDTAISNLIDSSPSTLNTLNELAAALGDDANFSTTVTNSIATKLPKAGGTITGNLQVNGTTTLNGNIDLGDASNETVTFTAVVDSDIYPETTGTHDLGNQFQKWDNVYANTFTGNAATATKLATARTIAGASFDGSANINISFDDLTNKPTIPTNNNQLTNGAGYVTSNTQLSNEQVQDIVGAMVSGNTETNISVTYDDTNGKLNFVSTDTNTDTNTTYDLSVPSGTTKIRLDPSDSSGNDDVEIAGGTNVTVTRNNGNKLTISATDTNTQLSNENVQDIVGAMVSGNSESGITVTYQDSDGTIDFSVASQTDNNFTTALKNKLDGIATGATNVTNNNQLTNGAGYVTSNTQLSNEQVQDIVGAMVSGNSESGITVTYQDSDGTLDFSVSSQTDNNFTTALKNKLDGIATSATNVTNNNQLTNGAGYITSSNSAVTGKLPKAGGTITGNLTVNGTTNFKGNIDLGDASSETVTFTAVVDSDIYPEVSNSHDLGNAFQKWDNVYANTFTGNAATSTKLATARTIAGTSFDGSANINISYTNLTNKPTIPTNNNQLTNGAGYVTANTQLSTEQVQDIVGAMVSGNSESNISVTYNDSSGKLNFSATNTNTQLSNEQVQDIVGAMVSSNSESGITVTYQDSDGTLDFSVASQTDQNFTTALKNKLDGIATGANNITNNNQLTNGAGYVTANTQLSNEQVQDIVGGMVQSNTASGITVTYSDSAGKLNFSVSSQTDNNFTNALKTKLDGIATGANNITNNNQLTNGAGYITSQRSVESVQDIVGAMVSSNSESGITVTYQDSDGTLDFSVSSQTDQNFTTALKNKLDGIASSATNVTNNNQLTNGAGYITSSNSAITNKLPLAGGTITGALNVGTLKLGSQVKEVFNNINNKLSNSPNIDVNSGNVHFFSGQSETANATPNIRGDSSTSLNSLLAIGETITVSIITVASGSGFYQNVTVDGSAPSFKRWLNDSEPSVAASSADFEIYTYTILKTANNVFTVLCNRSVFK